MKINDKSANRRLFHYTRASNAKMIIESGHILPATLHVPKNERPVVWLSFHPVFDRTALPAVSGLGQLSSMEELAKHETPFRFEVRAEEFPLGWLAFVNMSGCKKRLCRALADRAKQVEAATNDWRISFEPVEVSRCVGIEVWLGAWEHFEGFD